MENVSVDVKLSNLEKLKILVEQLENNNVTSDEYRYVLKEIENVIKEEKKVICKLKKSESKLEHYETICASILSLISTVPKV